MLPTPHQKNMASIIDNWNTRSISSKKLLPILFNTLAVLASALRREKDVKVVKIGMRIKLSLFSNYITAYIESPHEYTEK